VALLVFAILFQTLDHKVLILLIILGIYYAYDYRKIHRSVKETLSGISDTTEPQHNYTLKADGHKVTLDLNSHTMDPTIHGFLKKLRKYRRYNKVSYDRGNISLIQWHRGIRELESGVPHPRQIYENTESHYQVALQEFQGLGIASPSLSYGQGLTKLTKFTKSTKQEGRQHTDISTEVGEICKAMHEYGYYKMHNLALTLNADWLNDPNIYKSEIHLSDVKPANHHVSSHLH